MAAALTMYSLLAVVQLIKWAKYVARHRGVFGSPRRFVATKIKIKSAAWSIIVMSASDIQA